MHKINILPFQIANENNNSLTYYNYAHLHGQRTLTSFDFDSSISPFFFSFLIISYHI